MNWFRDILLRRNPPAILAVVSTVALLVVSGWEIITCADNP